jgi:hypothetical protein
LHTHEINFALLFFLRHGWAIVKPKLVIGVGVSLFNFVLELR